MIINSAANQRLNGLLKCPIAERIHSVACFTLKAIAYDLVHSGFRLIRAKAKFIHILPNNNFYKDAYRRLLNFLEL